MVTEQGIQGTTIALTHMEHVIGEVDFGRDGILVAHFCVICALSLLCVF